jgi:hypothetical protein
MHARMNTAVAHIHTHARTHTFKVLRYVLPGRSNY